jgi:acetylglutamate kinase
MQTQSHLPPVVIKVGGSFFTSLLNTPNNHDKSKQGALNNTLLNVLGKLHQQKRPVVLVHGGGEQVLTRLQDLGIKSERKDGLRVTPDEHMPVVTSVLAGELNKQLVAVSAKYDINAVGISLADGNLANCVEHKANIGAVGEPHENSDALLKALFKVNMMPVVASVGKDQHGRLYNVNADHAAICIAKLLDTKLYFFADVKGVLDENKQLIAELNSTRCDDLIKNNVITDGMIVKVKAAQFAATQIQQAVTIASWDAAHDILLNHLAKGTEVLPIDKP